MNILLTLLFGAIAGWLAGFFVIKDKGGLIWNIIIGLLGGVVGGWLLGLIGAGIPVALCLFLYPRVVEKLESSIPLLKTAVDFVPVSAIAPVIIPAGLLLGVGLGLVGSLLSIRKHLKV